AVCRNLIPILTDTSRPLLIQGVLAKTAIIDYVASFFKNLIPLINTMHPPNQPSIHVSSICIEDKHDEEKLSTKCLPPVEAADPVSYLVLETSFYMKDQFKNFRSLHAYNQMVSGFITKLVPQKLVLPLQQQSMVMEDLKLPKFGHGKKGVKKNGVKKNVSASFFEEASSMETICLCKKKVNTGDKLLKCHNNSCSSGKLFHLQCMSCKRYPNNHKSSWTCNQCKLDNICATKYTKPQLFSSPESSVDNGPEIVYFGTNEAEQVDKYSILASLTNHDFDVIESPTGWFVGISLFYDVILDDLQQQVENLVGEDFREINVVPIQQQSNGSDCGVFAIAFATNLYFAEELSNSSSEKCTQQYFGGGTASVYGSNPTNTASGYRFYPKPCFFCELFEDALSS
ncbi:Chromatin modification-related YNG2, partial [Paramuricea clavata]